MARQQQTGAEQILPIITLPNLLIQSPLAVETLQLTGSVVGEVFETDVEGEGYDAGVFSNATKSTEHAADDEIRQRGPSSWLKSVFKRSVSVVTRGIRIGVRSPR